MGGGYDVILVFHGFLEGGEASGYVAVSVAFGYHFEIFYATHV